VFESKNRTMVKHVRNSTLRTDFGFGFHKALAYIAKSPVMVVGQAIYNHPATAWAETFVT